MDRIAGARLPFRERSNRPKSRPYRPNKGDSSWRTLGSTRSRGASPFRPTAPRPAGPLSPGLGARWSSFRPSLAAKTRVQLGVGPAAQRLPESSSLSSNATSCPVAPPPPVASASKPLVTFLSASLGSIPARRATAPKRTSATTKIPAGVVSSVRRPGLVATPPFANACVAAPPKRRFKIRGSRHLPAPA